MLGISRCTSFCPTMNTSGHIMAGASQSSQEVLCFLESFYESSAARCYR